jgi:hypothetical protein
VAVHVTSHEPRALPAPPHPFEGGVSRSRGGGGEAAKLETVSTCGYVALPPHSLQHVLPLVDSSMRTHGSADQREGGSREGGSGEWGSGSTPASPSVNGETRVNVNGGHVKHPRVTFPAVERTVSDTASSQATHHTASSHTAPSHTTQTTEISCTTNGSRSTREPGVHAHAHAAWFQKHFGNYAATTALQQRAASRAGRVGGGTHFTCFTGTKVQVLTQHT